MALSTGKQRLEITRLAKACCTRTWKCFGQMFGEVGADLQGVIRKSSGLLQVTDKNIYFWRIFEINGGGKGYF